jgi:hypothetical protein
MAYSTNSSTLNQLDENASRWRILGGRWIFNFLKGKCLKKKEEDLA